VRASRHPGPLFVPDDGTWQIHASGRRSRGRNARVTTTQNAVIVTVPLVVLVLIFQRKIISGLTAGGVKG
jgi:ABC-type glycerol-3-phosphate transport system permease component